MGTWLYSVIKESPYKTPIILQGENFLLFVYDLEKHNSSPP